MPSEKLKLAIESLKKLNGFFLVKELKAIGFDAKLPKGSFYEKKMMEHKLSVKDYEDIAKFLFPKDEKAAEIAKQKMEEDKAFEKEIKVMENLKIPYKELMKTYNSLKESPYNLKSVEQLKKRIEIWVKEHNSLSEENQKVLRTEYDGMCHVLKESEMEKLLKGAALFEENMENDPMDLTTIDEKALIAGLKNFYAEVQEKDGKAYLEQLKKQGGINSFSDAILFLFGKSKEEKEQNAVALTNKFIAKKRIAVKYPAGVDGTYYRADNRPPKELGGGFTAFKVLTKKEIIYQIQKWFGPGMGPEAYHQDWISNKSGGDKIATGNDIGCMGYGCCGPDGGSRNVYIIKAPGLKAVEVTKEVLGKKLNEKFEELEELVEPHAKQGPKLMLNASTLEAATIIAVGGKTAEETTFFTTLTDIALIYRFKGNDESEERGWV